MARGRKTKLTEEIIEKICERVKLCMSWTKIAGDIGVDPSTIRKWMIEGRKAKSGIKKQLVDSVVKVESELELLSAQNVHNELLRSLTGSTTTQTEIRKDAKGNILEIKEIIKEVPPDYNFALKILERISPEWKLKHHIQVDYRKTIREQGVDPDQLDQLFFQYLDDNKESLGNIQVLPEKIA